MSIPAVEAKYIAAPFHMMVTNEGAHPAQKWAEMTASLILAPRSDATVEARAMISNLRLKIESELVSVFQEVGAATALSDIILITSQGAKRITELANDTPWAMEFASPAISDAIEELIRRNLMSANDIALKLE